MVAGLERITSGTVSFGDRVVNDVSPWHREVAMVFQNYALYPHLTVYQNIGFTLENKKVPQAELDRRVRSAAVLGLSELLSRKPRQLSGGQRQRVAMGRAIGAGRALGPDPVRTGMAGAVMRPRWDRGADPDVGLGGQGAPVALRCCRRGEPPYVRIKALYFS